MGQLFEPAYGTFVIELAAGEDAQSVVTRLEDAGLDANVDVVELGQVTSAYELTCDGQVADLAVVQEAWERGGGLESVFPYRTSRKSAQRPRRCPPSASKGKRPRPTTARRCWATPPAPRAWSSRCSPATTASTTPPPLSSGPVPCPLCTW